MTNYRRAKRIVDASPSDRTADVAVVTLRQLLDAVLHYLPRAAKSASADPAPVHQLRVWTRRCVAGLRLYADLLPRQRAKWIKKQLKLVRRAANDARDMDVLIRRLEHRKPQSRGTKHWLEAAREERREAQQSICDVAERLRRGGRFAQRIDQFLDHVGARNKGRKLAGGGRFGDWARVQLRPFLERFFADLPDDPADEAALHRFRIRAKELRYAVELLAGAFPTALRKSLHRQVEAIQDRLGEINDLATAKQHLEQKIAAAVDRADAAGWQRLFTAEQRQLDRACRAFWKWCTPQMLRDLRVGCESVLSQPRARAGRK